MGLTVKGSPITKAQIAVAEALLGPAKQLNSGQIASEALIFAAIAESDLGDAAGTYSPNSAGYWGVLQGAGPGNVGNGGVVYWPNPRDTAGMATAFLQGGKGFEAGGAIALTRGGVSDPIEIAVKVEVPDGGAGYGYSHEAGYNGPLWIAEARAIVAAYGGGSKKGGVAGAGGTGTVQDGSTSSTYAFQIGATDNSSEDLWTGINRLAQEVNWYLFSSGELLYYLDGQEMIAQKPALTLDRLADADRIVSLRGHYDNTAFTYVSDHLRKFKVQRKTKLASVTSPTEIQLDLMCGITEVLGGDVLELSSWGLLDGRWVVGDCTRSVFSPTSSLTLVPPVAPLTEASVAGTTGQKQTANGSGSGGTTKKLTGTLRAKVVQVARNAIAREASSGAYQYREVRPYPASLFGKAPIVTDCSGSAILCYKDAGAPDPNGTNFDGSGNTISLVAQGTGVQVAQPGDLVFYNTGGQGPVPQHVAVYLGNDRIFNMGGQGQPVEEALNIYPIVAIRSYL